MAESHTPGPWRLDEIANWSDSTGASGFTLVDADGKHVVRSFADEYYVVCANPADARLIAAAPDLEALLQEIVGGGVARHSSLGPVERGTICRHCGRTWPCPFDRAAALLARVKGEPADG